MNEIDLRTSAVCNNRCIFCMERNDDLQKGGRNKKKFLTPKELIGKIKNTRGLDRKIPVFFSSGEPTVNPYLLELVKIVKNAGYENIILQSNVRRLSYIGFVRKLIESGVREFSLSVHGSNSQTHDGMTRVTGSFEQVWKGIINLIFLKRKGFKFKMGVTCVVTGINIGDLRNFFKKFFSIKEMDYVNVNTLILRGNALKYFDKLAVKYSDIVAQCRKFMAGQVNSGRTVSRPGILGLPRCIGAGLENPFSKIVVFDIGENRPSEHLTQEELFRYGKLIKCENCVYSSDCVGVQKEYVERFGDNEFRPKNK